MPLNGTTRVPAAGGGGGVDVEDSGGAVVAEAGGISFPWGATDDGDGTATVNTPAVAGFANPVRANLTSGQFFSGNGALPLDNLQEDPASQFNLSTAEFTPAESGLYLVTIAVELDDIDTTPASVEVELDDSGSPVVSAGHAFTSNMSGFVHTITCTGLARLASGTVYGVSLIVYNSAQVTLDTGNTRFAIGKVLD